MARSLFRFLVDRNSKSWAAVWLVGASLELSGSLLRLAAQDRVVDPKNLPRFAPVGAKDALNTFRIRNGFRLELVAAEPLVIDPIALVFDESIFLAGGDMSCPGPALIQTTNLQARVPTITSVEANARQYLPQANKAWESRFPGMFRVTAGMLRTQEVNGPGLGAPEI